MLCSPPTPLGVKPFSRRRMLQISAAGLLASQVGGTETVLAAEVELPKSPANRAHRVIKQNVRVFTNRVRVVTDVLEEMFGLQRGGPSFLKVEVEMTIDRSTSLPVQSALKRHRHFGEDEFLDLSRHKIPGRKAMLFCHGYNYSFPDAVRAAARLKSIVGATSPMFVQSWPSLSGFFGYLGYLHDIGEIDYAMPLLRRQIINLLRSPDIDRLQIIGHSMASRAIVAALDAIFQSTERLLLKRISDVVLAAPDVDQDVMDRDYLPVADYAGIRTLVYVSNKDNAMWLSEKLNGHPRVGSTEAQLYLRDQITTVEVSGVDKSRFGHSAIFESQRLANDLHYFLNHGISAKDRFGLRPVWSRGRPYWYLEP